MRRQHRRCRRSPRLRLCHVGGFARRSGVTIRRGSARRYRTVRVCDALDPVASAGGAQSSQLNFGARRNAAASLSFTCAGLSSASLNAVAASWERRMLERSASTSSAFNAAAWTTNEETFRCEAAAARSSRALSAGLTRICRRSSFTVDTYSQWQYGKRLSSPNHSRNHGTPARRPRAPALTRDDARLPPRTTTAKQGRAVPSRSTHHRGDHRGDAHRGRQPGRAPTTLSLRKANPGSRTPRPPSRGTQARPTRASSSLAIAVTGRAASSGT